jgi:hypothetical protein
MWKTVLLVLSKARHPGEPDTQALTLALSNMCKDMTIRENEPDCLWALRKNIGRVIYLLGNYLAWEMARYGCCVCYHQRRAFFSL